MSGERDAMRGTMFLSQDGVVLCTTLRALEELGILSPSLEADRSLSDLCPDLTEAGFGSLRVAAHCLHSAGWLADPPSLEPQSCILRWTGAGRAAMEHGERYVAVGEFLSGFGYADDQVWRRPWERAQVDRFLALAVSAGERWGLGEGFGDGTQLIEAHLGGALAVPTMLWLHESDRLGEAGPRLEQDSLGQGIAALLTALGWLDASGEGWTAAGRQADAFALNFGGVATYLPLLARLAELYRGELTVMPDPTAQSPEWHVNRELNLRISAAAHRRYFSDSEPIFLEIFDREPVESQPRFIADMGCGEGSWLIHLHRLVAERTRRGRRLEDVPLTMVGIDPDAGALEQARRNLDDAGVDALLVAGDVTDPDDLQRRLAEHGLAIEDGLHIRAFIDHERSYLGGEAGIEAPGWSSGAYMNAAGAPLSGEEIERDLVAHLRRWRRHTGRHGMVVLEAHNVAPGVVARNLGSLHGIAFDAHQAYSKQYPVDHPSFARCCQLAGLRSVGRWERRYPDSRPFVAVSLNRLLATESASPLPVRGKDVPRADTWQPGPDIDLEDGRALHEILFEGGDIRFLAPWGSIPTGFVVAGALAAIETRLERAAEGEAIRVLDYGAGTGTASIELLKAVRERGTEQRLAAAGVELELHLVDIPASWFAQGYELLRDCPWTRFHSLRDAAGGFRELLDVTEGRRMDAVMANMVFHLIPAKALSRSVDGLADVLSPRGHLLWSSPDLGPARPHSVLLHDPNRALRKLLLERLDREDMDDETRREARKRAERRILPQPLAADVQAALARRFTGEIELGAYEMRSEDVVRGLLVPSNQAEYLPEVPDREEREQKIRELMLEQVIPTLQERGAGTSLGLNLHWAMGAFKKRD